MSFPLSLPLPPPWKRKQGLPPQSQMWLPDSRVAGSLTSSSLAARR